MMLLYTNQASDDLAEIYAAADPAAFRELVQRLVLLETSASGFEAMFTPTSDDRSPGTDRRGPRTVHLIEATDGTKFVIIYRLSLVDEDVWIERLGHGN